MSMDGSNEIKKVVTRSVIAPLRRPVMTAKGSIPNSPLVLIDIETSGDIVGHAYVIAYMPQMLKPLVAIMDEISAMIVGLSAEPITTLENLKAKFNLLGSNGLVGLAIAGVEMALWDALSKRLGVSLAELLGGRRSPVPAYDSYGIIDPVTDRSDLEESLARGFKAIKIKIGAGSMQEDTHLVANVRNILGDDVDLMVDFNQSLTTPDAIKRVQSLEQFNLFWVEEPVPAHDHTGHREVRKSSHTSVQTGENWSFPGDAHKCITAGASDMVMLNIVKIGGVSGWTKASAIAEQASLPISSHLYIEASANIMCVTPNAQYLEFLDFAGTILDEPAEVIAGTVTANKNGVGVSWSEQSVAKYLV